MKITILTLFPQIFSGPFQESIVKHAQEKQLVTINLVNIREFGIGKHQIVDDTLYGGGHGMLIRVDVLHNAIAAVIDKKIPREQQRVIFMGPHGRTFRQDHAKHLTTYEHIILICGHYEGIDERIKSYIDEEISIGDFILTGGEIPAMLVTDAVIRLLPGVLKEGVTDEESFSYSPNQYNKLLEYPQYTKPRIYDGKEVPDVLVSGDHKRISSWKSDQAHEQSKLLRPDLILKTEKE